MKRRRSSKAKLWRWYVMRRPCQTAKRLALLRAAWRNAGDDRTARLMAKRLGKALFQTVLMGSDHGKGSK